MTKDYVKELPDFIEKAATSKYESTDLVVFIGAGFSRLLGLPGWNEYASKKLNIIKSKGLLNIDFATEKNIRDMTYSDPRFLLSLLHTQLERKGLDKSSILAIEKEIFDRDLLEIKKIQSENIELIEAISNINAFFITTNYDNILEQVFGLKKFNFSKDENVICTQGMVWHIHGDINNSSINIVSSNQDYFKMYYQDVGNDYYRNVRDELGRIFKEKNILFLGYGLSEMELLQYLFNKNELDGPSSLKHVIVQPLLSNTKDDLFRNYYSELGIHLVNVDMDDKGYKVIHDLIIQWAEKLSLPSDDIVDKGLL